MLRQAGTVYKLTTDAFKDKLTTEELNTKEKL